MQVVAFVLLQEKRYQSILLKLLCKKKKEKKEKKSGSGWVGLPEGLTQTQPEFT